MFIVIPYSPKIGLLHRALGRCLQNMKSTKRQKVNIKHLYENKGQGWALQRIYGLKL